MTMVPPLRSQRVLLVGMMGSGKSTVGRALAERIGWPFLDNDDLLERQTGHTAHELLAGGLEALRAGEAMALREGLALTPPVIVGVAAGVVLDAAAGPEIAAAGTVIWLRARPGTLARRLLAAPPRDGERTRPWIDGEPGAAEAWLRAQDGRRASLYASLGAIVIDVDTPDGLDRPPTAVAAAIEGAIAAHEIDGG